jgi:hypothetical protein
MASTDGSGASAPELLFARLDRVCSHRWSARFDELPEALIHRQSTETVSYASRHRFSSAAC